MHEVKYYVYFKFFNFDKKNEYQLNYEDKTELKIMEIKSEIP